MSDGRAIRVLTAIHSRRRFGGIASGVLLNCAVLDQVFGWMWASEQFAPGGLP
jgi:hypothetical protein